MADMAGHATVRELDDLYWKLKIQKDEKVLNNPYCLFVIGIGFLNGYEALEYLEGKYENR